MVDFASAMAEPLKNIGTEYLAQSRKNFDEAFGAAPQRTLAVFAEKAAAVGEKLAGAFDPRKQALLEKIQEIMGRSRRV